MGRRRRLWPTYLLAGGYALLLLLPFLTLLSASLRPEADLYAPGLLPPRPSLEAYQEALTRFPLGRFLLNSLLVSSLITLGVLTTSLLAAYALARLRFLGREALFGLAVALLLVPGEVTFLPLYLLVDRLGWLDSYLALTVPFLANPLGVFLLRQFLRTIPEDYFDAARIDGANHWQMLRHVALPLSAPALGALAALTFIGAWNMYLWPLVVTKSREMQTAQIAVNFILNEEVARWNVVAAAAILVLLPSLLAFLLAQRAFVRGIAMGGLKG
ncbi:carbohydrate ABC transporter permease [Thermus tenuipuniceus]|uniref:carbohydrate ABC transporter permease n=1 Tax=Thermus tenuipuniceus TaxID=2078690 RepID=UPI000CF8EF48|nr:carbohydrate ABC transporter permease [Thermus tenuipuniceus]